MTGLRVIGPQTASPPPSLSLTHAHHRYQQDIVEAGCSCSDSFPFTNLWHESEISSFHELKQMFIKTFHLVAAIDLGLLND